MKLLSSLKIKKIKLQVQMSASQLRAGDVEDCSIALSSQIFTPKSNGSIITMTLKNNHLIVETEETSVSKPFVHVFFFTKTNLNSILWYINYSTK